MKLILATLLILCHASFALEIYSKPITFDSKRITLTKQYILEHYDKNVSDITIEPQMIVIHYTAIDDFNYSFNRFKDVTLPSDRGDISKASALNVSAHFLVDFDGKIYQLMPDNFMARHVIGLNYSAIGIENVGGKNTKNNLTKEQIQANIELVQYLQKKYKKIKYVIGHSEYRKFEKSSLWLEKNSKYRTIKQDPGIAFINAIRDGVKNAK